MITGVPFNRILVHYLSMAMSPAKPHFFSLPESACGKAQSNYIISYYNVLAHVLLADRSVFSACVVTSGRTGISMLRVA